MKKVLGIVLPVALCFLTGFIASRLQTDAVNVWYPTLNKSPLTPPDSLFGVAWSILYLCMGVSIGLIINSGSSRMGYFIRLFAVQLVLNFMWSILFFYFRNPLLGAIDIILLDILIILYAIKSWPQFKASSLLFVPYILWVSFATYLNLYILFNN